MLKFQTNQTSEVSEGDAGFTLIELLIVIVVLGILAAVVVFSIGGVPASASVAACQADGSTIATALQVDSAQGSPVTTAEALASVQAIAGVTNYGSNASHYIFEVYSGNLYEAIGGTSYTASGAPASPWALWTGSSSCTTATTK